MKLADKITQGDWMESSLEVISMPTQVKIGKISGQNHETAKVNAIAVSQLPKLLALVDIISQRLEAKYHGIPDNEIPFDELMELHVCRDIQAALLK